MSRHSLPPVVPAPPPDGARSPGPTDARSDARRLSANDRRIVTVLNDLLGASLDEMTPRIARTLRLIGESNGFDRTHVYTLHDDGAVIDIAHEWVAPGVEPVIEVVRGRRVEDAALWHMMQAVEGVILIDDVAAMGQGEARMREILLGQGVATLLLVPIRQGARLTGMLGFDAVKASRTVTPDDVFLLEAVASALGALELRARAERATLAAQTALEESRNRLGATLAAMPDLVLEVDCDGRYTDVHTGSPQHLTMAREALIGRLLEEVVPPDVAQIGRKAMREVDASGHSGGQTYPLETQGEQRWFELSAARRAPASAGARDGYVFVVRDITERTATQSQLHYRETILGGMFDLSPTGMILNDFETGRFLEANPAFLTATAYSRSQITQKDFRALLPPEHQELLKTASAQLTATGRYGPIEKEFLRADGSRFPAVSSGFMIEDPDGRKLIWSVVEDVGDRQRQMRALEESGREALAAQTRLSTAIEALPDGFALFDAEDRLVLCNRRYRQMFNTLPDFLGKTFADLIRGALDEGIYRAGIGREDAFFEWIMARHRSEHHETDLEMTDGRIIWSIEHATPDGGRVGLRVDATEFRRNKQRLIDVIEGAQVGTWEWNVVTGENHINDRWAEMLGYDRSEIDAGSVHGWQTLLHPDDLVTVRDTHARIVAHEIDRFDYTQRMRHAQGYWVWVQSRGRVLRWQPDGQPAVIAGVHIDISALREAEQRLALIIEGARVGTWQFDVATGEIRINERWASIVGYTMAELAPVSRARWLSLIHPEDNARLVSNEAKRFARGEWEVESEIRLRHKAGHWVWVLSRGQAVDWDEAGHPRTVVGVHLDITTRKDLEAQLHREHAFMARLMETSVSGIVAFDATGRIVFANKEAENVLGRSMTAIEGATYDNADWDMTDLDGAPVAQEDMPFARVTATGAVVRDAKVMIAVPGGSRRVLQVNAAPLSAPGLAATVVCTVTDITAAVDAETTLRAAMERAEAGSRAKSEFLANMSHEIRTPLNGVLGMAEVLGETLRDDGQRAMLQTIRESGELLLSIINDILDLAKIESGKLMLDVQPFVPRELGQRIEAIHGLRARAKGIGLSLVTDARATLPHLGDASRVMQILHNLVGNAVKFTDRGEVRISISGRAGAPLVIEIADTGIGMTDAQIARVFDDFTQADGSITRRFGGTGLGLPIVRRLAGLMGGGVSVTAEPGRGTRVRVDLPLGLAPRQAEASRAATPAAPLPDLANLRALVADDNATNRLILRSMLGTLGMTFTIVEDGDEAVAEWQPGRFDVLLLDISMPRKDGLAALQDIRRKAEALGATVPPALAVTANAMTQHVASYGEAGFADCVSKPIRLDQLARTVAQVCGLAE